MQPQNIPNHIIFFIIYIYIFIIFTIIFRKNHIKLVRSDSKDIYNVTKDFYFKQILLF